MPVSETARLVMLAALPGAALFHNTLDIVVLALAVMLAVNLLLDVLVLRRRRHRRQLETKDRQLAAVAELAAALARAGGRKEAATIVLDTLNELVGFDLSGLVLLDRSGRSAHGLIARSGGADVDWDPSVRIDLEKAPSGVRHAIESRAIFSVEDAVGSDEINAELVRRAGLKSVVFLPLESERGTFGVLVAGSTTVIREFRPEQLSLMTMLAAEGSLALERMESLRALEHALERERQVAEISRRVRAEPDLDRLLDATLKETAETLGVSRCLVRLGEPGKDTQIRAEWYRDGLDPIPESAAPHPVASRLALDEQKTVAIADVEDDPRLESLPPEVRHTLIELGSRSVISAPIILFDNIIGAITAHAPEPREWTDDEIGFLEATAREIGVALHTGGLIEENERRLEEHKALLVATEAMASELELDSVLARRLAGGRSDLMGTSGSQAVREEAVRQAISLLEADAALIFCLEGNELVAREGEGEGVEGMHGRRFPAAISLAGDLVHSRKPLAIDDLTGEKGHLGALDPIASSSFEALVGAPLVGADNTLIGALVVYSRKERKWRQKEVDALTTLAANTATALAGAELYLRVSLEREQSMAILSSVADGIVAVDRTDRVVLWNAAAERITGIASEEALGQSVSNVLRCDSAAVAAEESGDRPFLFKRGSREAWLQVTESTMLDPAGQIAGKIYTLRDISADRFVEQAKSDFVSLVSHELRAPLTSIYGFAETLLRRGELFDDTQRSTFLSYIAQESERLTGIVDALLDVAELDSGDLEVELATTDVSSLVREVVGTARAEVERNGADAHQFVVELPDEPLGAEADRDKLRRVLINLLDNAIKFSPRGGTVTVSGQRLADTVELRVADQGVGIPERERERIFRKFYRGSSSVLSGGTGVGLFITRGLMRAMGGRIWVDSVEGEGSTFGLELPSDEKQGVGSEPAARRV